MRNKTPLFTAIGVAILTAALVTSCLIVGCASANWQTAAGKFLITTAQTVDTTMKGAALLEVEGIISTNDWKVIAAYHAEYRTAMISATNAYSMAIQANDASLFAPESNYLFTVQTKLNAKVATVTPTK